MEKYLKLTDAVESNEFQEIVSAYQNHFPIISQSAEKLRQTTVEDLTVLDHHRTRHFQSKEYEEILHDLLPRTGPFVIGTWLEQVPSITPNTFQLIANTLRDHPTLVRQAA